MSRKRTPLRNRTGNRLAAGLLALVLTVVLTMPFPQNAGAQGITEYGTILAFTAILAGLVFELEPSTAERVVIGQLETAVNGAALANSEGDQAKEISRLSKAIGAAEALMGMTSSCNTCDQLRTVLQQIIGLAASLRASVLGAVTGVCVPEPAEQCNPSAVPTGCPVSTIPTFCNDECQCVPTVPVTTVP